MNKERHIIRPFNTVYFIFLGITALISAIGFHFVKDIDQNILAHSFLLLSLFQIFIIFVYRLVLFNDKEYCNAVYESDEPNYYDELPLNPCNVVTLLTPLAIIYRWRWICAFCFFVGFSGPIFALLFPAKGFEKYSVYKLRIILFYEYHWMCILYPHFFVNSGIYIPQYADCFTSFIVCLIFGGIAFFINRYLVENKKDEFANFFFVYNPHFNPVLEMFYKMIPYRFLYSIPAYLIFYLIFIIITFITRLAVSTL